MRAQLLRRAQRPIDRYGEAQSLGAAGAREDSGVHTDNVSLRAHQGTARVARVDGGIRLDHVGVDRLATVAASAKGRGQDVTADAGDHACRHGRLDVRQQIPERVADRDRRLANHEAIRITELGKRQLDVGLQQCQVGEFVDADERGRVIAAVGGRHDNLGRTLNDVGVGQQVAAGRNGESGAQTLDLTLVAEWDEELLEERTRHHALPSDDVDANDGRDDAMGRFDDRRLASTR